MYPIRYSGTAAGCGFSDCFKGFKDTTEFLQARKTWRSLVVGSAKIRSQAGPANASEGTEKAKEDILRRKEPEQLASSVARGPFRGELRPWRRVSVSVAARRALIRTAIRRERQANQRVSTVWECACVKLVGERASAKYQENTRAQSEQERGARGLRSGGCAERLRLSLCSAVAGATVCTRAEQGGVQLAAAACRPVASSACARPPLVRVTESNKRKRKEKKTAGQCVEAQCE